MGEKSWLKENNLEETKLISLKPIKLAVTGTRKSIKNLYAKIRYIDMKRTYEDYGQIYALYQCPKVIAISKKFACKLCHTNDQDKF